MNEGLYIVKETPDVLSVLERCSPRARFIDGLPTQIEERLGRLLQGQLGDEMVVEQLGGN